MPPAASTARTTTTRNGAGAAYVFVRTGTTWAQQAYIHPHNDEAGDSFGVNVSISDDGNTMLVGSLDEDCLATGVNPPGCDNDRTADISTGAAYVFVRNGATWSQQAYLSRRTRDRTTGSARGWR